MTEAFIDENFGRWMRSVTVEDNEERLQVLKTASQAAEKDLVGRELAVVMAAYGRMDEGTFGWLGAHLRAIDEGFVAEGKDEMLKVLAAVAVFRRIVLSSEPDAILCALAISSAEFSGMDAVIAELPQMARSRLAEMGRAVREAEVSAASSYLVKVPPQRKEVDDAGEATGIGQALVDIHSVGQAVKKLATMVDSSVRPALARQIALDEEIEMLWWVISDTDEAGISWGERSGVGRAVAGAAELAARTRILPEPPSARALLEKLLGKEATKEKSLAEFAKEAAAQEIGAAAGQENALLPVASSCEAISKFATDDDEDTWQNAMLNQLKLDPKRKQPLFSCSLQFYRELQMIRLLGE